MATDISIPELQVLFNLVKGPVRIKYPLYDFEVATLRESPAGFVLSGMCTRDDFEEEAGRFGELAYDMPAYGDVIQSMLAAGILSYRNAGDFEDLKMAYRKMNREVMFSLDTNMLYDGFSSNAQINPYLFLLTDLVQQEIESALNTKYSPQAISLLKRSAMYEGGLLDELVNQKMKRSRLAAYGALAEFQKIRDQARIVKGVGPGSSDKEQNDLLIVQSVKAAERFALLVHLTADINVADLCMAEGVSCFLFEKPHAIDARECTPGQAVDLVSRLAVAFGVVKVGPAFIYGEYRGKGARRESLKVVIRNPGMEGEFVRELELCRKLSGLGIER
ncbi:MAG TPA: hypothetical protein ENO06_01870 [Methanolinea sp.]|nr:hypothetical protein [Methanolinea sp.]